VHWEIHSYFSRRPVQKVERKWSGLTTPFMRKKRSQGGTRPGLETTAKGTTTGKRDPPLRQAEEKASALYENPAADKKENTESLGKSRA